LKPYRELFSVASSSPGALGRHDDGVLLFGVVALTFMMAMYTLEPRGRRFILAFAVGCALSSTYGFLSGAWPFGAVEAIWTLIAVRRWARADITGQPRRGAGPARERRGGDRSDSVH
jgi:hypothetical protein